MKLLLTLQICLLEIYLIVFRVELWLGERIRAEFTVGKSKEQLLAEDYHSTTDEDSEVVTSVKANSLWPAFASGAGLFSDGYVNNSISTVLFV